MDDVEDGILKVTLNRLDAFNREMLCEFIEQVENADEDASARIVMVTGISPGYPRLPIFSFVIMGSMFLVTFQERMHIIVGMVAAVLRCGCKNLILNAANGLPFRIGGT